MVTARPIRCFSRSVSSAVWCVRARNSNTNVPSYPIVELLYFVKLGINLDATRSQGRRFDDDAAARGDRRARSVVQVQRLAQHFLPLLFLGVTQESLDSTLVFLANFHDLWPDLVRVAAGLGIFDQRLGLFL